MFPTGLEGLQVLNVSGNTFTMLDPSLAERTPALVVLDLSSSSVTSATLPDGKTWLAVLFIAMLCPLLRARGPNLTAEGFAQHLSMTVGAAAAWGSGWPHLRCIYLDNIQDLAGTLPSIYANWASLEQFSANFTSLQGTFPSSWAALPMLRIIQLAGTILTGTLPDVWRSRSLEEVAFGFSNISVSTSHVAWYWQKWH